MARGLRTSSPQSGRPEHPTLVDEAELEAARLVSMYRSSGPPGRMAAREHDFSPERHDEAPVLEVSAGDGGGLDSLDEARVLLDAGDEAGALSIVSALLFRRPSDAPARALAEECEAALAARYLTQLGSLDRVPALAVSVDRVMSSALDHRAGFLISFVDGASTLATILDVSGMAASEVLGTFVDLRKRGIISLR